MAIAEGNCPNCGAPIEFAVGSSVAKVCEYCRHTVVRSDRGLSHLGKVADLAETPSLVALGDEGTLSGRPFRVMGRTQLDHGKGPWDEYYVAFDHGQSWGFLAYAEGQWFATTLVSGIEVPPLEALRLERDVQLGAAGSFRVAELKSGRIVSAEGELPGAFPPGFERFYADLWGQNNAFATLDYGDRSGAPVVFLGWAFPESALSVVALGPRSTNKVRATTLKCPNCGGDVPAQAPDRAQRLGCPYCGAVSDIAEQKVISQQEVARQSPIIPIGSNGNLEGTSYRCIATVRRGSYFEGELYEWEEFLLWSQGIGFRWLVLDPETGWSFVTPLNLAELELGGMAEMVSFGERRFRRRNRNTARVTYVLGEVYWKCEVGETTEVSDFVDGDVVISREASSDEVHWSLSTPLTWPTVAVAFSLPLAKHAQQSAGKSGGASPLLIIVVIALLICGFMAVAQLGRCGGTSTYSTGGGSVGSYRGGGSYSGGK
jgi:hypothetical protein